MKNYDLQLHQHSKNNLSRMATVAKHMYRTKTYPENLELELKDLINYLDSKLERWALF